ncbi:hypothetical protein BBP40_002333 [Aspergillus hancockii]|nr:hypothetical protein BBP40_002333 [Aspergillus hancockii]
MSPTFGSEELPPSSPNGVVPHHVSPHLRHGYCPITRTAHAQSLRDVDGQPGHPQVIRSENAPGDNGRQLSALVRFCQRVFSSTKPSTICSLVSRDITCAQAQKYVKVFCHDAGIPYVIFGFARGNEEVIGRLGEVAGQPRVWEGCRKVAAKDLIEGHLEH